MPKTLWESKHKAKDKPILSLFKTGFFLCLYFCIACLLKCLRMELKAVICLLCCFVDVHIEEQNKTSYFFDLAFISPIVQGISAFAYLLGCICEARINH